MAAIIPGPLSPIFGGAAASFGALALGADQLAQDPPDPEFRQETVARRWPLNERVLASAPGSRAFPKFMIATSQTAANLRAAVRAFERAQGAGLAGASDVVQVRLRETREFAQKASDASRLGARRTMDVASDVDEATRAATWQARTIPSSPDAFDPDALAFLYRLGVPINDLRRSVSISYRLTRDLEATLGAAEALRAGANGLSDLGEWLETWEPAVEVI